MNLAGPAAEALHRAFLNDWYQLPGWAAFVAALALALRWGGWAERWVGGWLLANYCAYPIADQIARELRSGAAPPIWWDLAIDLAFAPALLWPVVRSRRAWPLFFAAYYLLMSGSRGVRMIVPDVGQWAGVTAVVIWTLLAQLAFTVGVVQCALAGRPSAVTRAER